MKTYTEEIDMKSLINTHTIKTMLKLMGALVIGVSLLTGCAKEKPADDENTTKM